MSLFFSVIVCTHNRADNLIENLPLLLSLDYPRDQYEILVIDNASTDATADIAASLGTRCIREDNLGLSHARNRGIAEAAGQLIAFIDDDAWPQKNWLQTLEAAFADPSVACVGGRVIPEWKQMVGWPCWLHKRLIGFFTVVDSPDFQTLHYPAYPAGTNIAFRKAIFKELGGFNTELGRAGEALQSGEETELCLRIEQTGYRIVHTPEAVVHHNVHERRLTQEWVKERSYWQGISSAVIERKFFPYQRLLLKSLFYLAFTLVAIPLGRLSILLGQERIAFLYECQFLLCKAYLKRIWGTSRNS